MLEWVRVFLLERRQEMEELKCSAKNAQQMDFSRSPVRHVSLQTPHPHLALSSILLPLGEPLFCVCTQRQQKCICKAETGGFILPLCDGRGLCIPPNDGSGTPQVQTRPWPSTSSHVIQLTCGVGDMCSWWAVGDSRQAACGGQASRPHGSKSKKIESSSQTSIMRELTFSRPPLKRLQPETQRLRQ